MKSRGPLTDLLFSAVSASVKIILLQCVCDCHQAGPALVANMVTTDHSLCLCLLEMWKPVCIFQENEASLGLAPPGVYQLS